MVSRSKDHQSLTRLRRPRGVGQVWTASLKYKAVCQRDIFNRASLEAGSHERVLFPLLLCSLSHLQSLFICCFLPSEHDPRLCNSAHPSPFTAPIASCPGSKCLSPFSALRPVCHHRGACPEVPTNHCLRSFFFFQKMMNFLKCFLIILC